MAQHSDFEADIRARWLTDLGAVLREAERLTAALAACSGEVLQIILLQARIAAVRNSIESLEREASGKLADKAEPLWTIWPEPDAPRHDPFP